MDEEVLREVDKMEKGSELNKKLMQDLKVVCTQKLDTDIEYRKVMLDYLFGELKELREINQELAKQGFDESKILLNKISEIEKNLQILRDGININLT